MNFSKLDAFMQAMPARGIPGCELAITKDGKTVYRTSVGFADSARTKPINPKSLYWIFSATKVLTCIAAMRLVEEGRLSLEDPVSKYIPEYGSVTVRRADGSVTPAKTEMTVLHLFTMTGGLSYDLYTPSLEEAKKSTPATTLDLVRAMAKEPLLFDPGTRYKYSLCHDVLAAVVEVITGMRFSDYLSALLFQPLGITDMGFRPSDEQRSRLCALYSFQSGTMTATEVSCTNKYQILPNYDSGGAGLFASVDEYTKVISVIANGGTTADGYRILKPETIAMMQKNLLHDTARNDFMSGMLYGYGWGLCGRVHMDATVSLSRSPVGEFGWDGAANAYALIDTANRVSIFFGNHVHGCDYGYRIIHPTIRNLAYEGLETP